MLLFFFGISENLLICGERRKRDNYICYEVTYSLIAASDE